MKLLVTDNHDGEGVFPLFVKGSRVQDVEPTQRYSHWLACKINGIQTYVPDSYLQNDILLKDYNPTELIATAGEEVELLEIDFEWLYVKNKQNQSGWLPAEKAVSI